MGLVVKASEECYKLFGLDLDGCCVQENEGCGRCIRAIKYYEEDKEVNNNNLIQHNGN